MFGIPDVLDFLRSRKIKEGSTVQVIQRINGGLILGMDGKRIAMCDVAADENTTITRKTAGSGKTRFRTRRLAFYGRHLAQKF